MAEKIQIPLDEVKGLYYHIVWNWLPKEIQKEIEES